MPDVFALHQRTHACFPAGRKYRCAAEPAQGGLKESAGGGKGPGRLLPVIIFQVIQSTGILRNARLDVSLRGQALKLSGVCAAHTVGRQRNLREAAISSSDH